MSRQDIQRNYLEFMSTQGGQDLIKELDRQIDESHQAAEENPERARDYVLTAKAAREIKEHIVRMSTAARKDVVR